MSNKIEAIESRIKHHEDRAKELRALLSLIDEAASTENTTFRVSDKPKKVYTRGPYKKTNGKPRYQYVRRGLTLHKMDSDFIGSYKPKRSPMNWAIHTVRYVRAHKAFTSSELFKAIGAQSNGHKTAVSQVTSHLTKLGILERIKQGSFKRLVDPKPE